MPHAGACGQAALQGAVPRLSMVNTFELPAEKSGNGCALTLPFIELAGHSTQADLRAISQPVQRAEYHARLVADAHIEPPSFTADCIDFDGHQVDVGGVHRPLPWAKDTGRAVVGETSYQAAPSYPRWMASSPPGARGIPNRQVEAGLDAGDAAPTTNTEPTTWPDCSLFARS